MVEILMPVGMTRYIVRIVRTDKEKANGWNTSGPFVVRARGREEAKRYVRKTWCSYVGKSELDVQPIGYGDWRRTQNAG